MNQTTKTIVLPNSYC